MTRVVAILVVIISFLVLFRARHQAAHLVEQAVAEARDVNGGTAWFTQVPSSEAMCQ